MKRFVLWLIAATFTLLMGHASAQSTLGPGDVIKISVYGSPDLALDTRVSDTGNITYPLVGSVAVGGLTVAAAERKLAGLLESGGILKKAQVNIVVTGIQSQQVAVLGQVNRPGRYPIEGKRTVMEMLAMAGGAGQDGADTVTLVRKTGDGITRQVIDVVAMVRDGNFKNDLEVAANDILYVERAPRFYIYGEVQRPGAFRLERQMTVLQALAVGGGLTQRGTERGMIVKRRNAQGELQLIDVKRDDLLQTDDIVYIKESWF